MRPGLEASWRAFEAVHGDGTPEHAAAILGGEAALAIRAGRISNLSALKASYVFNHAGMSVPFMPRKTIRGGDGGALIALIRDLFDYLREYWGEADLAIKGGAPEAFAGMAGLMLFELPFTLGSGYATLWNGRYPASKEGPLFETARWVSLWEMDTPDGG
ncbi:Type VI secretion system (T6SS), amidase effector protein 4 [Arboricoccus pini]|uniref:Type VI secretion system (T6SS), amidase effector protein 4 n=1 Tax=Arboricoccus pini TaxID=1963835 RepID=A0A212RD61_9PROT|nr:hypothetical protein [Arboricoccus pini]SNB70231.1 Type VI secretion system (T6SS), amidase effector protein 4 [Arboricoccus pini]